MNKPDRPAPERYEDTSGTGMKWELNPIMGMRAGREDVVGAILFVDGVEEDRFSINDESQWVDGFGHKFDPREFSRFIVRYASEIRSRKREATS